ncbi:unnamed protein product [Enterobius vermicularis]|uniref:Mediator of RNA polymerase II transcription subunit 13 n=1 Tax=Enterobius vermicularis TaxID=51028 RepID=A0A0N4VJB0_ENTVE|nr:unnamed protein product [Enterobius vermicularis]
MQPTQGKPPAVPPLASPTTVNLMSTQYTIQPTVFSVTSGGSPTVLPTISADQLDSLGPVYPLTPPTPSAPPMTPSSSISPELPHMVAENSPIALAAFMPPPPYSELPDDLDARNLTSLSDKNNVDNKRQ